MEMAPYVWYGAYILKLNAPTQHKQTHHRLAVLSTKTTVLIMKRHEKY